MKGEHGSTCNRSACQTELPAYFYNHSTRKYYCSTCADLINEANKDDAMRIFGHDLCTYEAPVLDAKIPEPTFIDDYSYQLECYHKLLTPKANPLIEPVRSTPKIRRNQPCPCDSGKKAKNCCGTINKKS